VATPAKPGDPGALLVATLIWPHDRGPRIVVMARTLRNRHLGSVETRAERVSRRLHAVEPAREAEKPRLSVVVTASDPEDARHHVVATASNAIWRWLHAVVMAFERIGSPRDGAVSSFVE
jgi:hypothetical protein